MKFTASILRPTAYSLLAWATRHGEALGRSRERFPLREAASAGHTGGAWQPAVGGLRAAFTLIELLVVIVVIAVLMGITLPVSKYAIRRAKEARQEVMLAKIRSALDDYRAAYGEYPITPFTNALGDVQNSTDAVRHYPDNYPTYDFIMSNSPFTNVNLASSTVETISVKGATYFIDYALTYPLMFRQLDKGARPLMKFDDVTVVYLVWRTLQDIPSSIRRRTKSGWRTIDLLSISGDPVNRAKAIDPVSGYQWKYVCPDGINYALTTNTFR